jgi:transcriptional regulator with XRE-family HTH domain
MPGNYSPIFAYLRARRLDLKLSQSEVAALAGVTQTYLSKIEKGKIEPRLHTLEDLARALSLELRLIPTELAPTIHSLLQSSDAPQPLFEAEAE